MSWPDQEAENMAAEIEGLRAQLQQHEDAIWIGLERAKDVRNDVIEQCARVVQNLKSTEPYTVVPRDAAVAAIRALKESGKQTETRQWSEP